MLPPTIPAPIMTTSAVCMGLPFANNDHAFYRSHSVHTAGRFVNGREELSFGFGFIRWYMYSRDSPLAVLHHSNLP